MPDVPKLHNYNVPIDYDKDLFEIKEAIEEVKRDITKLWELQGRLAGRPFDNFSKGQIEEQLVLQGRLVRDREKIETNKGQMLWTLVGFAIDELFRLAGPFLMDHLK